MNGSKPAWKSKAVVGQLLAIVLIALAVFVDDLDDVIQKALGALGAASQLFALFGRLTATEKIDMRGVGRGGAGLVLLCLLPLAGDVGCAAGRNVLRASLSQSGAALGCVAKCVVRGGGEGDQVVLEGCAADCAVAAGIQLGAELLVILGQALASGATEVVLPVSAVHANMSATVEVDETPDK